MGIRIVQTGLMAYWSVFVIFANIVETPTAEIKTSIYRREESPLMSEVQSVFYVYEVALIGLYSTDSVL